MAQLRHDYQEFVTRGAEVIVVGPDNMEAFKTFWAKEQLPFIGLPDPGHRVAKLYGQQVRWLKMGRMPALMVIDRQGHVVHRHYGSSMSDIPPDARILALLDELNRDVSQTGREETS
jgi:peroxiredoxin